MAKNEALHHNGVTFSEPGLVDELGLSLKVEIYLFWLEPKKEEKGLSSFEMTVIFESSEWKGVRFQKLIQFLYILSTPV